MATDILDPRLKEHRNARWDKAFQDQDERTAKKETEEERNVLLNRKATIVIEHLMQASDVAYTMQHWHVYRKWNECFFEECYQAFRQGRATTNPADYWYQEELSFFDSYIIPLVEKLKECGVFGVSSDEYLGYALQNRAQWERLGPQLVAVMQERMANNVQEQHRIGFPLGRIPQTDEGATHSGGEVHHAEATAMATKNRTID